MKILMTMFQIQDYGGIINHAEHLAAGLKNNGCEVDFTILVPSRKIVTRNENKIKKIIFCAVESGMAREVADFLNPQKYVPHFVFFLNGK